MRSVEQWDEERDENEFHFSISVLTCVRIWPSQFVPLHLCLSTALGFFAPMPIPQILSLGLASTRDVPAVDSSAAFSSAFCEN